MVTAVAVQQASEVRNSLQSQVDTLASNFAAGSTSLVTLGSRVSALSSETLALSSRSVAACSAVGAVGGVAELADTDDNTVAAPKVNEIINIFKNSNCP